MRPFNSPLSAQHPDDPARMSDGNQRVGSSVGADADRDDDVEDKPPPAVQQQQPMHMYPFQTNLVPIPSTSVNGAPGGASNANASLSPNGGTPSTTPGALSPPTVVIPHSHIPRSKRRQVKNACTNCQKACKKCDEARPCMRCVKYGVGEGCVDSERRERKRGVKRGPYKKRDEDGEGFDEPNGDAPTHRTQANPVVHPMPMAYMQMPIPMQMQMAAAYGFPSFMAPPGAANPPPPASSPSPTKASESASSASSAPQQPPQQSPAVQQSQAQQPPQQMSQMAPQMPFFPPFMYAPLPPSDANIPPGASPEQMSAQMQALHVLHAQMAHLAALQAQAMQIQGVPAPGYFPAMMPTGYGAYPPPPGMAAAGPGAMPAGAQYYMPMMVRQQAMQSQMANKANSSGNEREQESPVAGPSNSRHNNDDDESEGDSADAQSASS